MKKDKAKEIHDLLDEIREIEYLADDDKYHDLEFLAKRLKEAKPFNYPRMAKRLWKIEKMATKFVRMEIGMLAEELNNELEKL